MKKEKSLSEDQKLDLILQRCKDNMSNHDGWEKDWVNICKQVAHNNENITCPLFRGYIYHLENIDRVIYLDKYENQNIYRATVTGLKFDGYVISSQKEKCLNRTRKTKAYLLILGTWLAGLGSIALVVWEVYKAYHLEGVCH